MNISGIVVQPAANTLQTVVEQLNALDGVEVHHNDSATSRIVATIEAENTGLEVAMLKTIKALPNVSYAEMVYHRFEDDPVIGEAVTKGLEDLTGLNSGAVPEYLNK